MDDRLDRFSVITREEVRKSGFGLFTVDDFVYFPLSPDTNSSTRYMAYLIYPKEHVKYSPSGIHGMDKKNITRYGFEINLEMTETEVLRIVHNAVVDYRKHVK